MFQVKISADGAKTTRQSNFVIVSHMLLNKTGELDLSSQGEYPKRMNTCKKMCKAAAFIEIAIPATIFLCVPIFPHRSKYCSNCRLQGGLWLYGHVI